MLLDILCQLIILTWSSDASIFYRSETVKPLNFTCQRESQKKVSSSYQNYNLINTKWSISSVINGQKF